MKMANIDAVFDFMFTSPKNPHGNSKLVILFECVFIQYSFYYMYLSKKTCVKGICVFLLQFFYSLVSMMYFILLIYVLVQEDFQNMYFGRKNGVQKDSE